MRSVAAVLFLAACLAAASSTLAQETSAPVAADAPVARDHDDTASVVAAAAAAPETKPVSPPARPKRMFSSGDATADQIADWLAADSQPVQGANPDSVDPALTGPRQIHGEVGLEVSNHGYGGYVATSMPLGQASELDVAASAAHVHDRWGKGNPKSIAIGLYLDGGDVAHWLSRDKCSVPRWGVALPGDPKVLADGSCDTTETVPAKSAR